MADEFTDDQLKVMQAIQENNRLVIFGGAAAGKTTLALQTVQRLTEQGLRVFFLCYSPRLANTIRKRLKGQEAYVADFRRFVQLLVQHQGIPGMVLPRLRWVNSQPWEQLEAPGNFELGLAIDYLFQFPSRFDAVIVDEGEKFLAGWWTVVESCLTDRQDDQLYVFVDNNLMVYEFQPNFKDPIFEAPLTLKHNYRNAAPIFELVSSLHPLSGEVIALSDQTGQVKEFLYSSDKPIHEVLGDALLTAEAALSDLQNIVVISAENVPAGQGNLNGMVFFSPLLQKSRQPGRLKWQAALDHYLKPFGFVVDELSREPFPASVDLRRVNRFCGEYKYRHKAYLSQQPRLYGRYRLQWAMDFYGDLRLHWDQPIEAHPNERDLLDFFSGHWERDLPEPLRSYRLTIPEDFHTYQDYSNIRLVDSTYFRGHEAQAVIFVMQDYFTPYDYLLQREFYEVFSRARSLLYLVAPFSIRKKIDTLAAGLID